MVRIERAYISAFGNLIEVEFGPFSERVTVAHGQSAAGGSTLNAFIQTILFGFPPTSPHSTTPVSRTGRYGGHLILRDGAQQRYLVERYLEQRDGAARVTLPDGSVGSEEALAGLLGSVSREQYRALLTISLDDLLSDQGRLGLPANDRMYGVGIGGERLPTVLERFQRQADELIDGDQADDSIAATLRELADIERLLAASRRAAGSYQELRHRRDELNLDIRDVDFRIAAISRVEQRLAMEQAESAPEPVTAPLPDDPDSAHLRREIDELREHWTQEQAAQRMIDVYESTIDRQRLPRSPWFLVLLMTGVLLPVVLGGIAGNRVALTLGIAAAGLSMVTLVLAAVARSRFESAQLQATLHLEMTHREAQSRFRNSARATGIDPDRVAQELARLEHAHSEALAHRRPSATSAANALSDAECEWQELVVELALPESQAQDPAAARAAAEAARDALHVTLGRLDEQLRQLVNDRQSAELRFQREELLTLLGDQTRAWSRNVAAGMLLREAADAYARKRQPEALHAASDAFDAMTLGAYHKLIVLDGNDELIALGRDGREVQVAGMGREMRELARLALRIGCIRAFGESQPLPVLVDDILVQFNPERATEAMRALASLTWEHQLILFTNHASSVELARAVLPGTRLLAVRGQTVFDLTPLWFDSN